MQAEKQLYKTEGFLEGNNNVIWHPHKVSREERSQIKKHRSCVVWFTGLPSSGKSTIAHELEYRLNNVGIHTYVLDGDNVRHGLNKDLGFSTVDRKENIRRIAEVARLFADAGILTITAFISPFSEDRRFARVLIGEEDFIEVYTKCPVEVCKKRDPKGLYKKAIAGEIRNFTGVTHPYEEPKEPEILIETDKLSIEECVEKILYYLKDKRYIAGNKDE